MKKAMTLILAIAILLSLTPISAKDVYLKTEISDKFDTTYIFGKVTKCAEGYKWEVVNGDSLIVSYDWQYQIAGDSAYDLAREIFEGPDTIKQEFEWISSVEDQLFWKNRWCNFIYGADITVDYGDSTRPLKPLDLISMRDPSGLCCGLYVVQKEGKMWFAPFYGDDSYRPGKDGMYEGERMTIYVNGLKTKQGFVYEGWYSFFRVYELEIDK